MINVREAMVARPTGAVRAEELVLKPITSLNAATDCDLYNTREVVRFKIEIFTQFSYNMHDDKQRMFIEEQATKVLHDHVYGDVTRGLHRIRYSLNFGDTDTAVHLIEELLNEVKL